MFQKLFLSLCAISCLVIHSNASIGPILRPCKTGEIECVVAANIRTVIPCFADGIPELGVRGIDPMNFQNITMNQGYFKLEFPYLKVFGTRQCKVLGVKSDLVQSTIAVTLECPLEAIGKYVLSAKSFFFDIKNEGNILLQSDLIRTTITSKYETIYGNDGKQYWNLIDYEYFYEPLENFHIELGNLFSGDIGREQFFMSFMPNGWFTSFGKIAEPVVSPIVERFYTALKLSLHRLAIL